MPPKRKSTAQAEPAKKRKSAGSASEEEAGNETSPPENNDPALHDYVVIQRHMFDVEAENNAKAEEDQLDEDELDDKYEELTNAKNVMKPASDFPGHKWIAMAEAWKLSLGYHRKATYTCPDMFAMHIYNDFCSLGIIECMENVLLELDTQLKKEETQKDVLQIWTISAAFIHWIATEQLGPWIGCDDGDRVQAICGLIGTSFLATLNELDVAGLLKPDTQVKDLGLVISMYIYWSHDLEAYGIDADKAVDWRKDVIGYAKEAGIDLAAAGLFGTEKRLASLEEKYGEMPATKGDGKADRWGWKKALNAYTKEFSSGKTIGGNKFNILRMSKQERIKHNFDNQDPLAKFSAKDLREGNIMIG